MLASNEKLIERLDELEEVELKVVLTTDYTDKNPDLKSVFIRG